MSDILAISSQIFKTLILKCIYITSIVHIYCFGIWKYNIYNIAGMKYREREEVQSCVVRVEVWGGNIIVRVNRLDGKYSVE